MDEIEAWLDRAVADETVAWACRGLSVRLCLDVDGVRFGLLLADRPRRLSADELDGADIRIEGPRTAFASILCPRPAPGFHSYGALLRHDTGLAIAADSLIQAQALAALERLIGLARPAPPPFTGFGFPHDPAHIVGHYRQMETQGGRRALLHWTEAGTGAPLVLLHTAGADARQFRHQVADLDLQSRFRMMAFDMPWHGLSSGEDDRESTVGYSLTEAAYLDWCAAFLEQVAGGAAILCGCSMGAAIALTLTARRPDLVRGCIALEAPMTAPGRRSDLLTDARVANGLHNPAYVRAMLGPDAPERQHDEACAIYAQARPGIYMGDLVYYSEEHDSARIVEGLRASGRPVELLTGSFDYSASPANTRRLHAAVDAETCRFTEMEGLGHFPMIENPDAFRPHFLAALDRIESATS